MDNLYFVKKRSQVNSVYRIVNNGGMEQVFVEYPERMKNGHKSSVPIRLAVDWHFRGECLIFTRLEDFKIMNFYLKWFIHLFNACHNLLKSFRK